MAMQNCDVLLAVGARFDDRVIGNPSISPRSTSARSSTSTSTLCSISKRVKVDIPIVGDVRK